MRFIVEIFSKLECEVLNDWFRSDAPTDLVRWTDDLVSLVPDRLYRALRVEEPGVSVGGLRSACGALRGAVRALACAAQSLEVRRIGSAYHAFLCGRFANRERCRTIFGRVFATGQCGAMVAQQFCKLWVAGSSPVTGSTKHQAGRMQRSAFLCVGGTIPAAPREFGCLKRKGSCSRSPLKLS